ncbi:MAG: hypothetical protein NC933_05030, partial [Candidatus Omnitrophica bacterium]|nr:hypothetical protein [Candidatus Omnitrophota bacterium]
FYLGEGATVGEAGEAVPAFTWQKRVDDLLDFASYGDYGIERSGMITGSVMEDVSWNDVGGNGNNSFLRKGVYQNTEVNVNAYERLWKGYSFEGQVFVRRTDDRRIERRKDLRLKQLTTKIYNSENMLLFGDFYGDFSQFVLGNSLEGFALELKGSDTLQFKGVAARSQSPDPDAATYWRNVAGGKADLFLFQGSEDFTLFRNGLQVIANEDDRGTVDNTNRQTPIPDLHNVVVSWDGEINFRKFFSVVYELAGSAYTPDQKVNTDVNWGTALRIQPRLRYGPFSVKYLYYYVTPQFYTDSGSAMPDKMQHQFTVDADLTKKARLSFVENYYWDRLARSERSYRTTNDEQYITLTLAPLDKDPDFNIRAYTNIQQRNSDDPAHLINTITLTPGLSINDNLDEKTSYGLFYEFRGYTDRYNSKSSDYFYRLGGNVGREQQIFGKRFYCNANISMDFHDQKSEDDDEVITGFGITGQYNFLAEHMFYFGYNVNASTAAGPAQGYFNAMNYAEFNLLMEKKRNTRVVLRGEFNRYNAEDSGNAYDETRIITRFLSNF